MNADFTRKEAAFMDWYLPKKDQRTVPEKMSSDLTGAVDPSAICITFIGAAADRMHDKENDFRYDMYDSDGKIRQAGMPIIPLSDFNQRVVVDRAVLMKLLEPMTSDYVIFDAACDYPLRIIGGIGEKNAAAILLPIIKGD